MKKKSFTLIELMIVIIILTLSVEYIFSFLKNTISEVNYMKTISNLSFNSFRAMEVITKGVSVSGSYLNGTVTASNSILNNTVNKIEFSLTEIELKDGNLTINNLYKFNLLKFENLESKPITSNLYEISFKPINQNSNGEFIKEGSYSKFSRIVYVQ